MIILLLLGNLSVTWSIANINFTIFAFVSSKTLKNVQKILLFINLAITQPRIDFQTPLIISWPAFTGTILFLGHVKRYLSASPEVLNQLWSQGRERPFTPTPFQWNKCWEAGDTGPDFLIVRFTPLVQFCERSIHSYRPLGCNWDLAEIFKILFSRLNGMCSFLKGTENKWNPYGVKYLSFSIRKPTSPYNQANT